MKVSRQPDHIGVHQLPDVAVLLQVAAAVCPDIRYERFQFFHPVKYYLNINVYFKCKLCRRA